MSDYTTQMDAARKGIITPQMKVVAEKEHWDPEELRKCIAKGEIIKPNQIRSIRPGFGIPPKMKMEVIGKRANKDLKRGEPLSFGDWEV